MTPDELKRQQDEAAGPRVLAGTRLGSVVRQAIDAERMVQRIVTQDPAVKAARDNVEADRARGHAGIDAEAAKQSAYTEAAVVQAKATQAASAASAQARLDADKATAQQMLEHDITHAKAQAAASAALQHAKVDEVAEQSHKAIDEGKLPGKAPPTQVEPPGVRPVDTGPKGAHDAEVVKPDHAQEKPVTNDHDDPRFGDAGKGDKEDDKKPAPLPVPVSPPPPPVPPNPFTYVEPKRSTPIALIVALALAAAIAVLVYLQYVK
jgi:hypothetical protein